MMRIHKAALFGSLIATGTIFGACGSDPASSNPQPGTTTDTNGNTVLPDGTVVAPNGNVLGKVGPDGGIQATSSSSSAGGDGDAAPHEPPPVPYTDFDVNHILMVGQSNSVALGGVPPLTTSQPYANVMFDTGVITGRGTPKWPDAPACDGEGCARYDAPTSFVPLVEGDLFLNYRVETAASSIANQLSFLASGFYKDKIPGLPNKHDLLMSVHGRSGNTYWCLRKNGCTYKPGYNHAYDDSLQGVQSGMQLAQAAGKSYVVRAIVNIHGESDHYSYTAGLQEFPMPGTDGTPDKIQTYADGLLEWQHDYETDVTALTHQTQPIPMFVSQLAGWNDAKTSKVAQYQLDAHERAPGKIILIGPSYEYDLSQVDCRHFTSTGQQHLGEMFAKVYAKVIIEGKTWEPVRPKTVTKSGSEITVQFFVPEPPLVFDTDLVAPVKDMGFEYVDATGAVQTISKVELTGPDTVKITLASDVGPGHLTYAQNQVPNTCVGPQRGARGNIRDSDKTPSQLGTYALYNWVVNFDVEVK